MELNDSFLLSKPYFYFHLSNDSPIFLSPRGLGLTIAVVLLLAFVERPSSLSVSSDPRHRSPPWNPPCGLTESIEMVCLLIFSLDLAVKVSTARVENICSQDISSCLVEQRFWCGIYCIGCFQIILPLFKVIAYLFVHLNHCFPLSSELLDWLGGIQKEQMADWLHSSDFSLHHRLGVVCQHGVWWGEAAFCHACLCMLCLEQTPVSIKEN